MTSSPSSKHSFWALCRKEPFRIFFPLGLLVGLSGVSLWPLYFKGLHKFYPGMMHSRLMIEGFLGAFVIGFLGTAGPRLTDSEALSWREFAGLLMLYLAAVGVHIGEQYAVADGLFFLLLTLFAALMIPRFRRSEEWPPPSFVLVGFGLASAWLGTALILAGGLIPSPYSMLVGMDLLNQCFVLCALLGVGGFLLPRFLKISPRPEPAVTENAKQEWQARATCAVATGAVIVASYLIEVFFDAPRPGALLRFGASAVFFFFEVRIQKASLGRSTIARWLQISLLLLLAGLAFPLLWPLQRVAGLHILFIGAFTLATFAVATRVVLGHSGQLERARGRLPLFTIAALLLVVGMVLRVVGDFYPESRSRMLTGASHLWLTGAILWGCLVLPRVRKPDPEDV